MVLYMKTGNKSQKTLFSMRTVYAAIALFSITFSHAASKKKISLDLNKADISAINFNFDKINNELLNTVHRTGTERVYGYKYFENDLLVHVSTQNFDLGHSTDDNMMPTGMWFDKTHDRLFARSLILGEYDDPVDLILRRATGLPGTTLSKTLSGDPLGTIYWPGWSTDNGAGYHLRIASIYARAAADVYYSSAPGRLFFATQRADGVTNDLPTALGLDEYQRACIGCDTPTSANLEVSGSTESAYILRLRNSVDTDMVTVSSGGAVAFSSMSYVFAYANGDQTFTTAAGEIKIDFLSETKDRKGEFSLSTFTVTRAGDYEGMVCLQVEAVSAGTFTLHIRKNASNFQQYPSLSVGAGLPEVFCAQWTLTSLAVGDKIDATGTAGSNTMTVRGGGDQISTFRVIEAP